MEVKILIPSFDRAKTATTQKYVAGASFIVPESKAAEYREYNPDVEVLTHPDSVVGLNPKRDWMYKTFGTFFSIDDDTLGFKRLTAKKGERTRLTPEEAHDVCQFAVNMAKLTGCYLCTFNYEPNPLYFSGHEPIRMTGNIGEIAFGMVEGSPKLYSDPRLFSAYEWYISGINAHYHRKVFVDNRFVIHRKNVHVGGMSLYRTLEKEKNDLKLLIECFGSAVYGYGMPEDAKRLMFQKKIRIPF